MQHLIKSVAISRLSALRHRYLRALLVAGATAALRHAMAQGSPSRIWAEGLLRVNAARKFLKSAEVKFPSFAGQGVADG
jgi:hypothetical protein